MNLYVPICPECHHRGSMRAGDPAYCYCKCHDAADLAPELLAVAQETAAFLDVLVPGHMAPELIALQVRVRNALRMVADQKPF